MARYIWVFPKIGKKPKLDGENNGKPLLKWMIWGENPLFLETSIYEIVVIQEKNTRDEDVGIFKLARLVVKDESGMTRTSYL